MFAIAITLLVLEISVPPSEFHHLWYAIGQQWPSYLSYATSFTTIGGLWLAHHGIFRRITSADQALIRLNLALLMTASFLPFPTRLMAEAINVHEGEHAAVLFYGGCLLVITTIVSAMARYAAHSGLAEDSAKADELQTLARRMNPSLGFFGLVILAAAFAPRVAVFGFLYVALLTVVRNR